MTLDQFHAATEAANQKENALFDFIVNNGIATRNEVSLVTSINGYTVESMTAIIKSRTNYRSAEQCIACEPESYEDLTGFFSGETDHKTDLLRFINDKLLPEERETMNDNFDEHALIGKEAEMVIYSIVDRYTEDNELLADWRREFFDDADDIFREL